MKIITCQQGSADWFQARVGIPTASKFDKIVTPTGKLSKQARDYAIRLATERLMNRSTEDERRTEFMQRGTDLEPAAVKLYTFETGLRTLPVGFITTDDGRVGASPDRLVEGENGAVEIKSPAPWTHLGYLIDGFGPDYIVQAQGQILVGEFDWVDRYSFHPEMPPVSQRTYRDEAFVAKLSDALDEFCDMVDAIVERAKSLGVIQAAPQVVMPGDARNGRPFLHTIINPWSHDGDTNLMAG